MNHEQVRDLFSSYYEHDLDPGKREALESHLTECPDCSRLYTVFKSTVEAVRRVPQLEIPHFLYISLRRRADRRRRKTNIFLTQFYQTRVPHEVFSLILLCVLLAIAFVIYAPDAERVDSFETTPKTDVRLELKTRSPAVFLSGMRAEAQKIAGAEVAEQSDGRLVFTIPAAQFRDFIVSVYRGRDRYDLSAQTGDQQIVKIEIKSK